MRISKELALTVAFCLFFALSAWGQDATTQSEIDELKKRIEELEKNRPNLNSLVT